MKRVYLFIVMTLLSISSFVNAAEAPPTGNATQYVHLQPAFVLNYDDNTTGILKIWKKHTATVLWLGW